MTAVDWSITSEWDSGTVYGSGTASGKNLADQFLSVNQYGYNIDKITVSNLNVPLESGKTMSKFKQAIALVMSCFILQMAAPAVVRAVYVRPNEISIERPYIERHIQATTAAFGLNRNATESPFTPSGQGVVDPVQDATLLANVRLWDLRAYGATITQIQALRPYYTFPDTDVDRYFINGRIKQVLLSPREIDVSQLSAEASESWINPRFIYTHGFGAVVAEVNKITPDGLPVLLIEDAPPEIKSPGFQLSRPEIYCRPAGSFRQTGRSKSRSAVQRIEHPWSRTAAGFSR